MESNTATVKAALPQQIVPIFSGGGTRLAAHIGILKALQELNLDFKHIVGVSGGSIVAALYSAGMNTQQLLELVLNTNFKQFRGYSLLSLLRNGGLSSGDKFENWLDQQLGGITFRELSVPLHVLATDVNGGGPIRFDAVNSPDLKVSQAVRYSISIPLIFSFKQYGQHLLVDGAILSEDALFDDWTGDGTPQLCFRLKSENSAKPATTSLLPLTRYIQLLIRTFMTAVSREYVHANYWHNTVIVNTGTISPVDFDLTKTMHESLFLAGYQTVKNYLPQKLHNIALKQA